MLTLEEFKDRIGRDTYRAASEEAWSTAKEGTKRSPGEHVPAFDETIDAADDVFGATASTIQKMQFLIPLYNDIPSYAVMMRFLINIPYDELTPDARMLFWDFVRNMMSSVQDELADPMSYLIWADFFESQEVNEAWRELVSDGSSALLLERVLIASGPVPFELKRKLYESLIPDKRWHYYIFRSLLHSNFDVYGNLDRDLAKGFLERLELPTNTEYLQKLRDALGMTEPPR